VSARAAASFVIVSISPALLLFFILLMEDDGRTLLRGVPDGHIAETLRPARRVDGPLISRQQAIEAAAAGVRVQPGTQPVVREVLLLWLTEDSTAKPPKERLVWGVNFDNPDEVDIDPGVPGCSVDREALYVIALIDAITGENVMLMGAYAWIPPDACPGEGDRP
jgi:hypothetical protein